MELKYDDEPDLQRKIAKLLNKQGFEFIKTKSNKFCDLIDLVHHIYIEVKPEAFAPAQILYGLARNKVENAEFIGLACAYEVRFYKAPELNRIKEFAQKIDPDLKLQPSAANRADWNEQAFALLGVHEVIYFYQDALDLTAQTRRVYIDSSNLKCFERVLEKYQINIDYFLKFIGKLDANNYEIGVNNEGRLYNKNQPELFQNYDAYTQLQTDYKPIRDFRDRTLLESARIKGKDVTPLLHQRDRSEPIHIRRESGLFWTKDETANIVATLVDNIHPDFVIEPYVGGGSLIEKLVATYAGTGSDIEKRDIDTLSMKYEGTRWSFTNLNTITTPIADLKQLWHIPETGTLLILTNPPFGTGSTNALASRKGEVKQGKSRKQPIEYGGLEKAYGKGDLVIPAVAKLIELLKDRGSGCLAFFAPAGVFCGRERYNKLLKALLTDFEFLDGYIFSGEKFNSVASKKAIAFTVWKYDQNHNTAHESLVFNYEGIDISLKEMLLLKDGWRYDTRKIIRNEIAVQHNAVFNDSPPKMFHIQVQKGGSELVPENVKIDLQIPNVPSELAYGLWSVCVGYQSITTFPIYINEAHTHLPDFTRSETLEILAYAVIHTLITELKNNNCKGQIGFVGMTRVFKFGNDSLTNGSQYLIDKHASCPIDKETISSVFNKLQTTPDSSALDQTYRKSIKAEIESRLNAIGYWECIPIPMKDITKPKKKGK